MDLFLFSCGSSDLSSIIFYSSIGMSCIKLVELIIGIDGITFDPLGLGFDSWIRKPQWVGIMVEHNALQDHS